LGISIHDLWKKKITQVNMHSNNILLLLILTAATVAAYAVHLFWKKKIDPRKSVKHFFLYLFAHIASIFILVFIFGFFIIRFKEFLIKK